MMQEMRANIPITMSFFETNTIIRLTTQIMNITNTIMKEDRNIELLRSFGTNEEKVRKFVIIPNKAPIITSTLPSFIVINLLYSFKGCT